MLAHVLWVTTSTLFFCENLLADNDDPCVRVPTLSADKPCLFLYLLFSNKLLTYDVTCLLCSLRSVFLPWAVMNLQSTTFWNCHVFFTAISPFV